MWRVVADFAGYSYRVLRRQQRPVRLSALPTDMKWQQTSLALFLLAFAVGLVANVAWLSGARAVLFVAFFGFTLFSFHRGKRDTVRWTRDWVGSTDH